MKMHHRVQDFAAIVSMTTTDYTKDVSLFIDYWELFFLIVAMTIDFFRFHHN